MSQTSMYLLRIWTLSFSGYMGGGEPRVNCTHCVQYKTVRIPVKTHEKLQLYDNMGCLSLYEDIYSQVGSDQKQKRRS